MQREGGPLLTRVPPGMLARLVDGSLLNQVGAVDSNRAPNGRERGLSRLASPDHCSRGRNRCPQEAIGQRRFPEGQTSVFSSVEQELKVGC